MASDCRDRYRNHIQNSEDRAAGPWTKDEEMRLTQIVTDMTVKQGKDMDNDVFWGIVSERMGAKRGRQQCRIKWYFRHTLSFRPPTNMPHLLGQIA
jgi:Myb-like DNA-binding domain